MIIRVRQPRRASFLLKLLLVLFAIIELHHTQSCYGADAITNEEIAVNAMRQNYPGSVWTAYEIIAEEQSTSCLRNSKLYETTVEGPVHPPPVALVVIGDDKLPYIFPAYKAYRYHNGFSKVIAKEKINIREDNLASYVKTLLCLLDMRSFLIFSIDELEFLPGYIKRDIAKYAEEVRWPQLSLRDNKASIVFCAWHRWGTLSKWKLDVALNGEILFIEVSDLATYDMGVR